MTNDRSIAAKVSTPTSKARQRTLDGSTIGAEPTFRWNKRLLCTALQYYQFCWFGWESWSSLSQDVLLLQVFDHQCFGRMARFARVDRVGNTKVKNLILGTGSGSNLSHRVQLSRSCWLDHLLRVINVRLPYLALFHPRKWRSHVQVDR